MPGLSGLSGVSGLRGLLGGESWTPGELSPLLWARGNTGLYQDTGGTSPTTTSGQPVALWDGLGGTEIDATQETADNQPAYVTGTVAGQPAVEFGGDDFLTLSENISGSVLSILAVVSQSVVGGDTARAILSLQSGSLYATWGGEDQWGTFPNTRVTSNRALVPGEPTILSLVARDNDDIDLVTNGFVVNQNIGASWPSRAGSALGADSGGSQYFKGRIYELVLVRRAITTAEREAWERYAARRYGVTLTRSGAVRVSDHFTEGDGTLVDAHTQDVGSGWTHNTTAQWVINGNVLEATNFGVPGFREYILTAVTGTTYHLEALVNTASLGGEAGLLFHYVDSFNYWYFSVTSGGTLKLVKRVAGTETTVDTLVVDGAETDWDTQTFLLQVSLGSDSVTATARRTTTGSDLRTLTATGQSFSGTPNSAGLIVPLAFSGNATFDDFLVTAS